MKSQNVIVNGQKIYLRESDYKAKGGQGVVFLKDNVIYKIYHDKSAMIPEQKIYELQELKQCSNVIVPQKQIYDERNNRIGFTLKYVENSESLCKVFTNSFKTRNNISKNDVSKIADNMRETLIKIHTKAIVGDYNEMNFLINSGFNNVYYIDTDSYQTKSFKCNAIMHQYRDRLNPLGTFNKRSDWFSWALVTFRLYCGIHPFRGRHTLNFEERMDKSISVFDSNVTMPKNIDLNVIPKVHLEYYKDVFVNKNREIPPKSDGVFNLIVKRKLFIDSTSNLTARLFYKYDSDILDAKYRNSTVYVLTKNSVYEDITRIGGNTGIKELIFSSSGEVLQKKGIVFNNAIYEITKSGITQTTYEKLGRTIPITKTISTVAYNSSKLFQGVVLQDIYGKYTATIPYGIDKASNVKISELNETRIIDAKRQDVWLFVVYEKNSKIDCLIVYLKNKFTDYECTVLENVDFLNINAVVKSNGIVILNTEDCKLQLFMSIGGKVKVIDNTPIYNDYKLVELHKVCFTHKNELYELISK